MEGAPVGRAISAEERFLLAASAPFRSAAAIEQAAHRVSDWSRVLDLAGRHVLAAPLAVRLERLHLADRLSPEVRARIERLSQGSFVLDQWNLKQLVDLRQDLDRARVPFMLLKGQSLAERLYEDPAERTSRDIDLLVPADRMSRAVEILEARGYAAVRKEVFEQTHFHVPFRQDGGRGPSVVELHWDVTPSRSAVRFETDRWWANARRVALRCGEVLLPPEADELVHLAWHAFSKGTATLRDLSEVAMLWRMHGARFSRESLRARAERASAGGFLREALFQCASLWGEAAGFPPEPEDRIPARRWIARKLFEIGAIVRQDSRPAKELRRIAYWSLLPRRKAGLPHLFREAIREETDEERMRGATLGWKGRASAVAELVRALGLCAAGIGFGEAPDV